MWYLQLFSYFIASIFCIVCFWFSYEVLRENYLARKWDDERMRNVQPDSILPNLSVYDRLKASEGAEIRRHIILMNEIDRITA